jgi:hypothetical protein
MVKQQEGVEIGELTRANASNQVDPRTLYGRLGPNDLLDGSNGHVFLDGNGAKRVRVPPVPGLVIFFQRSENSQNSDDPVEVGLPNMREVLVSPEPATSAQTLLHQSVGVIP